jgi:hypothetical protein
MLAKVVARDNPSHVHKIRRILNRHRTLLSSVKRVQFVLLSNEQILNVVITVRIGQLSHWGKVYCYSGLSTELIATHHR